MITPQEIIKKRNEYYKEIENDIDSHLESYFSKVNHLYEYRYNVKKDISDETVHVIMNRYALHGWRVEYKQGCDDRPCAEPYRYIVFSTPN
jgi:hypothetical protein